MVVALEVALQRRGSLHAPKQKHSVERPWSNGSRAALESKNTHAQFLASQTLAEADGSGVEEEKKLLGKRGRQLKQAGRINCLAYVPEARVIAAGREDGTLLLWKFWKTEGCNKDFTVLTGHGGRISSLIYMPQSVRGSGSYLLFSGSSDLSIKIWDPALRVSERVCVQTLLGHGGTVTCMALVGRNNLVTGSTDATIRLWRAANKELSSSLPVFALHRTIAIMDDWVNAMSFDTTKRVGDLGILYAADSAGGVTAFLPQVAEGLWRPDGTTPLDFSPAGPATAYGLLGSAKSVRLFGMGATSRGTSATSFARSLSTRCSSRAADSSGPPSPEPPNPPLSRMPELRRPSPSRTSEGSRPVDSPPAVARAVEIPTLFRSQSLGALPSALVRAPALERINEVGSKLGRVSPERSNRVPTRFSPDVEAHSDAKEAAQSERARSGSRASTSNRDDSSSGGPTLSRSPTYTKIGGVRIAPATTTVTSPKPAFARLEKSGVSHAVYDAAHHMLMTLARDQRARAYDEQGGNLLFAYENPHRCLFTGMAWDRAHQEVILVDEAGYVYVYSQNLPGVTCCKQVSSDTCAAVLYMDDLDTIAAVCGDHVVLLQLERERDFHTLRDGHRGPVVAFSYVEKGEAVPGARDSDWLFSAGADGVIKQWDLHTMTCKASLQADRAEPSSLLFCEAEDKLMSGHEDGSVCPWNLDTRQALTLREHTNTVTGMVLFQRRNGDRCLATASFDGTVAVWNIHGTVTSPPHLIERFVAHEAAEILCIACSQNKELLFTAGNDMEIKAWSTARCEPRGALRGHSAPVTCLLLEGDQLFSGSEDGTIRQWDVSLDCARAYQRTLEGQRGPVTGLVFQRTTGRLLSSSHEFRVCVWDIQSGLLLKTIAYADELRCLAARSDSDEILVGTHQGSIVVSASGTENESGVEHSQAAEEQSPLLKELGARIKRECLQGDKDAIQ